MKNRLESLINGGDLYPVDAKIEQIINKVLTLIKFPINLGDGGLYLDGLFFSNIVSANDLIKIPLKAQVRYDGDTFNSTTCQNDLRPVIKSV